MSFHSTSVIYRNCFLGEESVVGEYSVIGKASRVRHSSYKGPVRLEYTGKLLNTLIGIGCYIGSHVIIEEGVSIGDGAVIDDGAVIESGVRVGAGAFIVHGARICEGAQIGCECVIGGFIADYSKVGDRTRVLGQLLHRQEDPTIPWDVGVEAPPELGADVFVGASARIIGGVVIPPRVYVCAGAIITQPVASDHVAFGINESVPIQNWTGALRYSTFWQELRS